MTRAAVFRDPGNASGIGQFAVIQAMAPALSIEVMPINVRDAREIERAVAAFASVANGGLIATGGPAGFHRDLIFKLAVQHRLPAVYPYRYYVDEGGLISYGPDLPGLFRQAAGYVDQSSRARSRPTSLCRRRQSTNWWSTSKPPRRSASKSPPTLLARADEVIE